jgi:hypothetical protein
MQVLSIINQVGPLPIAATFTAPLDGPALLVVTGSLWGTAANVPLRMNVLLDGKVVGTAQIFSNGSTTHRVLPTLFLGIPLTFGSHTLQLTMSGPSVTSDLNDSFAAALLY